jgi:hypothetical protein
LSNRVKSLCLVCSTTSSTNYFASTSEGNQRAYGGEKRREYIFMPIPILRRDGDIVVATPEGEAAKRLPGFYQSEYAWNNVHCPRPVPRWVVGTNLQGSRFHALVIDFGTSFVLVEELVEKLVLVANDLSFNQQEWVVELLPGLLMSLGRVT